MTAKLIYHDESKKVLAAADKGIFTSLHRAAFVIWKTAKESIVKSSRPAVPGHPPHTKRGRLRSAIRYDVDKQAQVAVIGPRLSVVARSAAAHEFGGKYLGDRFPARPFMGPALEGKRDRIAGQWRNSVHN